MWRSLVARGVWDAEVAGSNPAIPTYGSVGFLRPAVERFAVRIRWQTAQTRSHFSSSSLRASRPWV